MRAKDQSAVAAVVVVVVVDVDVVECLTSGNFISRNENYRPLMLKNPLV